MQWDKTLNAGFSSASVADLYMPLGPVPGRPDVEAMVADKNSLWHEVKKLNELRLSHKALQNNPPIEFLSSGDKSKGSPLAYRRGTGKGSVVVALNLSSKAASLELSGADKMRVLYSIGSACQISGSKITLPVDSGVFLIED
jgi:maltose alpha-D-glucosyltransferase/alpha-amylase